MRPSEDKFCNLIFSVFHPSCFLFSLSTQALSGDTIDNEVIKMAVPKDPMILLSYVNTQLRDNYSSLSELCRAMDIDEETLKATLDSIGFSYNLEQNRFK